MNETLTLDRQQDIYWYDAYPGQFYDGRQEQAAGRLPSYLANYAADAPPAAAEEALEQTRQHGRNLGYMALTGVETGVQRAGGLAEAVAAIALMGTEIPHSSKTMRQADYALAA